MTDLIPRAILFGNPDRAMTRLSPDGRHVAFLAPDEGVLNLWVASPDDLSAAKAITADRGRGIRTFFWAPNGRQIIYLQDENGDENWRAHAVAVADGASLELTPIDGVATQVVKVSHRHPDTVLLGINDRDPRYHDVYRVSLSDGSRELLQQNEGYAGFVADDDLTVRVAVEPTATGGHRLLRKVGDDFELMFEVEADDGMTTSPIGFDASGDTLYLVDSRGRDKAALMRVPLGGEVELIGEDPDADVSDALLHPTDKTVQAYCATYDRRRWRFLDAEMEADFQRLRDVCPGDVEVTSRTRDDRRWTVAFLVDDGPARTYLFDRDTKEATFLHASRTDLEGLPLAPMRPAIIPSRDGLSLVSYLTLPHGTGERPQAPLPMVLLVHGGPWARDGWGYHPEHQWLANRGYAVLSVNFRGSTGFGKSFINAGDGEWAAAMHNDLLDAVKWAVEAKIADEGRIAIMGGSYGGYATLVGLTFTPEVFACGVDIVGPSNLLTLLDSIPPYWAAFRATLEKRVGSPQTDEGKAFLRERSPLFRADKIVRPLLIGQGANDPRVKQAEADQIATAMTERSIPVTYVLYPDEGHGFARPENRTAFMAIAEAFLAGCLGGRAEPFGGDLAGASYEVVEGSEHVPGLE